MTLTNKQIQALKAAAEKATPGEWWSDVIDAEDITTYAVYGPDNRSLLDMLNSTAAEIHEEYDRDYFMQWDEAARRNADFIAKAHPEFILSLLASHEADKALIAEQAKRIDFLKEQLAQLANFNPDWDMLEATRDSLREHIAELTAANKRIAELEARTLTVKLPKRKAASDYVDEEFDNSDLAAIYNACRLECEVKIKDACAAAGITLKVEK